MNEMSSHIEHASAIDKRRVRFDTIDGIEREDIPLACEVWIEDIFKSRWADPNTMKLAMHFARYITHPDPQTLQLGEIEQSCLMSREDVSRALQTMRAFGAAITYSVARAETRATLNLSLLQRLRVLELKRRVIELDDQHAPSAAAFTA